MKKKIENFELNIRSDVKNTDFRFRVLDSYDS